MKTVRIALLQMPVIPGRLAENLNTAKRMILSACNKGCDIAILPECCDFGWADESVAQSEDLEAGAAAFFWQDWRNSTAFIWWQVSWSGKATPCTILP